jgi:hypothetical protein
LCTNQTCKDFIQASKIYSEFLFRHCSCYSDTRGVTEAILLVEVNLNALRIARQNELSAVDYHNLMLDRLDKVSDERMRALGEIERDKLRVARAYNKIVKEKSFQVGDLVWKTILTIGSRSSKFGKWSPNWEGPYRIEEVISGNSYMV